jgi:hypothetical protein
VRQFLQVLHGRQHDDLRNFVQSEGRALTTTMRPLLLLVIADWRYCLAAAPEEHKVDMSESFQTNASMIAVSDAFSGL